MEGLKEKGLGELVKEIVQTEIMLGVNNVDIEERRHYDCSLKQLYAELDRRDKALRAYGLY